MKLDRNLGIGRGKYALIKLRQEPIIGVTADNKGVVVARDAIDYGDSAESDFFVIRLKDKYAARALRSYAYAAHNDDPEYAAEVLALAVAAENHPSKQMPT